MPTLFGRHRHAHMNIAQGKYQGRNFQGLRVYTLMSLFWSASFHVKKDFLVASTNCLVSSEHQTAPLRVVRLVKEKLQIRLTLTMQSFPRFCLSYFTLFLLVSIIVQSVKSAQWGIKRHRETTIYPESKIRHDQAQNTAKQSTWTLYIHMWYLSLRGKVSFGLNN